MTGGERRVRRTARLTTDAQGRPALTIPPSLFADPDLSLKAKGVFGLICAQPTLYNITAADLARQTRDGPDAVGSALRELERHGYLLREYVRDDDGKIDGMLYTINATPSWKDSHDPVR